MSKVYIYVVARDFGFAPNPFHGYCTLATCKPGIRAQAGVGDWIIGMGGSRLKATGKCLFAMRVSAAIPFNDYWSSPQYFDKRPVRNGSRKMMVGDNIYHSNEQTVTWVQADSHHSNPDGSPNEHNIKVDTGTDRVLISDHFFYFGSSAKIVPNQLLKKIGYSNGRNYRVFEETTCSGLLAWLYHAFGDSLNLVLADPFDFESSDKRYSAGENKIL